MAGIIHALLQGEVRVCASSANGCIGCRPWCAPARPDRGPRRRTAAAPRTGGRGGPPPAGRTTPKRRCASPDSRPAVVPQALDAMRDQRGLPWLEDLARDAAYGWCHAAPHGVRDLPPRRCSRSPSASARTPAIYQLLDAIRIRTLPVNGRRAAGRSWSWPTPRDG